MKKKILHIINSMDPGGAEMLLSNTLKPGGLSEITENHLVYFNCPTYLVDNIDPETKIHFLDFKGKTDIFRLISNIKKIILENKIDIVHSHLNPAGWYTHLACPSHIPQVHTVHIAYSTDADTRAFLKFLEKKIYFRKKSCNLIFLSDFTKKDFLDNVKFKGQSFVLPNFIDDSFFNFQPKEVARSAQKGLKVLAVGNFRPQKNYFYLLEIFKELKETDVQLDIYGGGETEKHRQFIKDNDLKVSLKGQIKNINEIIANYDLFIMASSNEGFPLSVFEAMAAGVPVMLSSIPPLTSIVGDNAIYFDLDNAEKAAKKLVDISENRIDVFRQAVNAKQYAGKIVKRDIYIAKLCEIYSTLLGEQLY